MTVTARTAPLDRVLKWSVVGAVVVAHLAVLAVSTQFFTNGPHVVPDRVVAFVDLQEPAPPKPLVPPPPTPPPPKPPQVQLPVITEKATPDQEAQAVPAVQTPQPPPPPAPAPPAEPDYLPQFKVDQVPVMPEKAILAKIVYPPLAAKQGIEAVVILLLHIDDTGHIRAVSALKDPGFGFLEAAKKALDGLVVQPAQAGGKPVAVMFRYAVRFKLK